MGAGLKHDLTHFDAASPGLLNLRSLLPSMSVRVDGRKLKWRTSSIKRLVFFKSQPLDMKAESFFLVEFRFR